ncbi:lysine decarboxylase [Rhodanobacter aciditrophus]|uniref:Lysine decarboxylase n=1 Tax=Rhodanobacter aciditrophus TaxID=1623218 RepID=A0ABW4B0I0_9GAMM
MFPLLPISILCLTPDSDVSVPIELTSLTQAIQDLGGESQLYQYPSQQATLINQIHKSALLLITMVHYPPIETTSDPTWVALRHLIENLRQESTNIPIVLMHDQSNPLPTVLLEEFTGVIGKHYESPEELATQLMGEARHAMLQWAPPFFKALMQYSDANPASWHCPGHSGGAAFARHPIGQAFHDFFGENMFRADVCNAVEDLGQLLDHSGPIAESERKAAEVFQADHLYFVTNGTSSSNKIVWHSHISVGDIVVIDRNCHKSILHAVIMTGAIPIFLNPVRNGLGMIGPVPKEAFSWNNIMMMLRDNPLVTDKNQTPKLISITQCTYDGVLYNADSIKQTLDGYVEVMHFDEAWSPHTSFHPFYEGYHAVNKDTRCDHSLVFSTQSTHKLLAGLSQASQILVQHGKTRPLDHHRFNEAYLMHTSTSPHYPIIASCDITSAMMTQPSGAKHMEDVLAEAIGFRKKMQALKDDYKEDWWFTLWGPDVSDDNSAPQWQLTKHANWHGFDISDEAFNLLDPLKVTVVTPGLSLDGSFDEMGVPAAVAAKFLAENGVIVEKVGMYSFLLLFTLGATHHRWQTLISVIQRLKQAIDENAPLIDVMPNFVAQYPQYKDWGLNTLCQKVHNTYRERDFARVTQDIYSTSITPAMTPSEAYAQLTRGNIERVPLESINGRITTMLVTPYPPGIPLLVPGERFNEAVVAYLQMTCYFNDRLTGFETHTHGLVQISENGTSQYYVDCVVETSLADDSF